MLSNDSKKYRVPITTSFKKGWGVMLSSLFLCLAACVPTPETKSIKEKLPNSSVLETQLDNWHLAAANADSAQYFDFIAHTGRFLGTDATENWSKEQFLEFSTPYFRNGKAWSFRGFERHWYYSGDSAVAWFDERLDTWMGECRGSGVIILEDSLPKLSHYNLSVTIANEKIQEFIALSKANANNESIAKP